MVWGHVGRPHGLHTIPLFLRDLVRGIAAILAVDVKAFASLRYRLRQARLLRWSAA